MVDIRDFQIGGDTSLDDFKTDREEKKQVINKASSVNMAANISLISFPDNLEENFNNISEEMQGGSSETARALQKEAQQRINDRGTQAVYEILADPTISEEDKKLAIQALEKGFPEQSASSILAEESLASAGEPDDSEEVEQARLNMTEYLGMLEERKAENQRLQNIVLSGHDTTTTGKVVDLVEYLIPFSSFAEGEQLSKVLRDYKKGEGLSDKEVLEESFLLLANMKDDLKQISAKMTPQERMEFSRKIVTILGEHPNLVLPDGNSFSTLEILSIVQDPSSYSDLDWTADLLFQGLDLLGLGALVKAPTKLGKVGKSVKKVSEMDEALKVQNRTMKSEVKEASPSQTLKDTNPEAAKKIHKVASEAEGDEIAQATYGTTKTNAVANDVLPEIVEPTGTVRNKVHNIDSEVDTTLRKVNDEIVDVVSWKENSIYFDKEIELARSHVVNKFQDPVGLTVRDNMFSVKETDAGTTLIRGVYGPSKMGFKSPEEAVQHVQWSFRDQGITEKDMILLKRVGDEYVETSIKEEKGIQALADEFRKKKKRVPDELKAPVDYLVGVGHEFKADPSNVPITQAFDTKGGLPAFFDRATSTAPFTGNVIPPTSYLDPKLTAMSTNIVDRSAGLEKAFSEIKDEFAKGFKKLPKERQHVLSSMIKEANAKSKKFTETWMLGSGLTKIERDLLKQWEGMWDTIHWIDNKDLVSSLKNKRFMMYENKGMGSRFIAKPLARNQISGNVVAVYDETTDSIKRINKAQINKLYEDDGGIAELRRHMDVGGEKVKHIVVENTPTNGYLRSLNDQDNVLAYRAGYYQVYYKDPIFVTVIEKAADGSLYERAVGTAGNTKDAEHLRNRLLSQDPDLDITIRKDIKQKDDIESLYLDIAQASGRSSQRRRGKRLEAADSNIIDPSQENILDPVQSLTKSISSLSNRVSMRDYLEVTKKRMMKQFSDVFPKDLDTKQVMWPTDVKQIGKKGELSSKFTTEAKQNWKYIDHMENGWANLIDDGWRGMMNLMAEKSSDLGISKLEEAFFAASKGQGPTGAARNLAFTAYLTLNPARQLLIQSGQALQLFANYAPTNVLQGYQDMVPLMLKLSNPSIKLNKKMEKLFNMTDAELTALAREYKISGFNAAVDINNLVRHNVRFMDESDNPAIRMPGKAINMSRRVGFDAGEQINMMMAYLTARRQKLGGGSRKLTNKELSEVMSEARNYTYNMNKAGDLDYNNNAAALILQFAQVPHKYITNVMPQALGGSRRFTPAQKARVAAFNTVMFGVPSATVAGFLSLLPDNAPQELVDAIEYGATAVALNTMLTDATGEPTRIDWTDFAPSEIHGFMDMLMEISFDKSLSSIITESPSGSLLFGKNARVTEAFKSVGKLFNFTEDPSGKTDYLDVLREFAEISSGFSNGLKSVMAFKLNQTASKTGVVIDEEVSSAEAFFKIVGLTPIDEDQYWKTIMEVSKNKKDIENNLDIWYNELSKDLANEELLASDIKSVAAKYNAIWAAYGDVPYAMEYLKRLVDRDAKNGVYTLPNTFLKMMEWQDSAKFKAMVLNSPLDDQTKQDLLSMSKAIGEVNG